MYDIYKKNWIWFVGAGALAIWFLYYRKPAAVAAALPAPAPAIPILSDIGAGFQDMITGVPVR